MNTPSSAARRVESTPPWSDPPTLWLPSAASAAAPSPAPSAEPRPSPPLRPRVLVADDDPGIVELTSLILHFSGYDVATAEDGEVAWRAYLEQGCDLLLTDHNMPRLSGLDLIARVRTHGDTVPVILASGRLDPEEIPFALRNQIDAFLAKPFPSDVLIATVRRCLRTVAA